MAPAEGDTGSAAPGPGESAVADRRFPPDPEPGDAVNGAAILAAGIEFDDAGDYAAPDVHAFEWLRDLRAVDSEEARDLAQELVADWIDAYDRAKDGTRPWRPAIAAERLVNWLYCRRLLMDDPPIRFAKAFDASFARHVKRLGRTLRRMAPDAERFPVIKALVFAGVGLPKWAKQTKRHLAALHEELEQQILLDGGHSQRNPSVHAAVLSDLVQIRRVLEKVQAPAPEWLQETIAKMAPVLRFFRYEDGGLALFNGSTEEDREALAALLVASRAPAIVPEALDATGYHRLESAPVTVLVDTGIPPAPELDFLAHAGPLAFEMSIGPRRLIVNCGAYRGDDPDWHQAARSTAAHSTLVIDDTNACEVLRDGGLGRRLEEVEVGRDRTGKGIWFEASHDGYLPRFHTIHRRRLELAADGRRLHGVDRLEGGGEAHAFIIRFHLHPRVDASIEPDSALEQPAVRLTLDGGEAWRFHAESGAVALEESVYLGRPGRALTAQQVTVSGRTSAAKPASIAWSIERI